MGLGVPEVFNSDQGTQFTSESFTSVLKDAGVRISMDGVGRAYDNIFVERLWRSLKHEEVYLHDYEMMYQAQRGVGGWFEFYDHRRPHQALGYRTPAEVYGVGDVVDSGTVIGAFTPAIAPVALRAPCAKAGVSKSMSSP